jgi:hypothetical protein
MSKLALTVEEQEEKQDNHESFIKIIPFHYSKMQFKQNRPE